MRAVIVGVGGLGALLVSFAIVAFLWAPGTATKAPPPNTAAVAAAAPAPSAQAGRAAASAPAVPETTGSIAAVSPPPTRPPDRKSVV